MATVNQLVSSLLEDGADDFDFDAPSAPVPPKGVDTPEQAYDYAVQYQIAVTGNHYTPCVCVDVEPMLATSAFYAMWYACSVLRRRWPEAEPVILSDPEAGPVYRKHFGIAESEEIPDLDTDLLDAPPDWRTVCLSKGLTNLSPDNPNFFSYYEEETYPDLVVGKRADGTLYVRITDKLSNEPAWRDTGTTMPEYDIASLSSAIDRETEKLRKLECLRAFVRPVQESEIPDLDADLTDMPKIETTWQDICDAKGLESVDDYDDGCLYTLRGVGMYPDVTVSPVMHRWQDVGDDEEEAAEDDTVITRVSIRAYNAEGECEWSADEQVDALVAIERAIDDGIAYVTREEARHVNESEEIPDLDADALDTPPITDWRSLCISKGLLAVGRAIDTTAFVMRRGGADMLVNLTSTPGHVRVASYDNRECLINSEVVPITALDVLSQAIDSAIDDVEDHAAEFQVNESTPPGVAYLYAKTVAGKRCPYLEPLIRKNPAIWEAYKNAFKLNLAHLPLQEAWSPEQREEYTAQGTAKGAELVDTADFGPYTASLWRYTRDNVYELSFNFENLNFFDPAVQKAPSKTQHSIPVHAFIEIVRGWLKRYGHLAISTSNDRKFKLYARMFKRALPDVPIEDLGHTSDGAGVMMLIGHDRDVLNRIVIESQVRDYRADTVNEDEIPDLDVDPLACPPTFSSCKEILARAGFTQEGPRYVLGNGYPRVEAMFMPERRGLSAMVTVSLLTAPGICTYSSTFPESTSVDTISACVERMLHRLSELEPERGGVAAPAELHAFLTARGYTADPNAESVIYARSEPAGCVSVEFEQVEHNEAYAPEVISVCVTAYLDDADMRYHQPHIACNPDDGFNELRQELDFAESSLTRVEDEEG